MASWTSAHREKVMPPDEAVRVVKSGDIVYISGNAATPYPLLRALARRKDELFDVQLVHVLLLGEDPLSSPEMAGHFRHNSLFVGPGDREAVNEGRADYVPIFLHKIPQLIATGQLPIDVAMVQTAPPDRHGFLSLGVEVLASKAACEHAKTVIALVNDRMPRTFGDSFVHVSQVKHIVAVSEELPTVQRPEVDEISRKIGEHIATLIEDGDTLQLGIGQVSEAVLAALRGKRDLGVHTEMISDGIMEAVEEGIVTGARKNLHIRQVVGTFALGSRRLYEYLDNNPMFHLHPVDFTNDPFLASENDRLVAVNSALELDLTGQVCSDSLGTYIYSGVGGQVDFMRAAARSRGGKPIIALPSTAKGGTVSRIVPSLKQGAGVVTSRADVYHVVTEFGVAYLFGKNLRERAKALISLAHPQFRLWLEEEAHKLKWLQEAPP